MDYEKAYREALTKSKEFYELCKKYGAKDTKEFLETTFPELQESEDEKIRKDIIAFIKKRDRSGCDYDYDKWIAWLEKQKVADEEIIFRPVVGTDIRIAAKQALEKIEIGKKVVLAFNGAYIPVNGKTVGEIDSEYDAWLEKQGDPIDKEKVLVGARNFLQARKDIAMSIINYLDTMNYLDDKTCGMHLSEMERKDIEDAIINSKWNKLYNYMKKKLEKPTDKIEPKFKVGDWVVNRFGDVWHIDSFDSKNYQVSNGDKYCYFPIKKQDEMNLWSIKDAKPGDILASGNIIIMCKLGSDSENIIYSYCSLDNNGKFTAETETDWLAEYFYPATKEQRDTLEKAMTSAGYTFDFDNEELKKIRQKPTDKDDPRFNVDDWIVSTLEGYYKVISINQEYDTGKYYYILLEPSGNETAYDKEFVDEHFHLWTIADAKDGDVLVTKNGENVFIFKSTEDCICSFYASLLCGQILDISNGKDYGFWNCSVDRPATKEQRDLLFQKISDAGYTFDFKNKELKKIKQKSTNKIKSKFHEGDWVVKGNVIAQILDVQDQYYVGLDTEGNDFTSSRFLSDDKIHLWTIQDAKDGDILAGKINGDSYILICKQIKDGWIETYGHYYSVVDRFCIPSRLLYENYRGTLTPATKEQRELLFQKIKEACLEWDADKKELKKIRQKPGTYEMSLEYAAKHFLETLSHSPYNNRPIVDAQVVVEELMKFLANPSTYNSDAINMVENEPICQEVDEDYGIDGLWHARRILEKTLGKVDGYQSDDGILEHKCAIQAVNQLYKQKMAWSKEDEENLQNCLSAIYTTDYYIMEDKQKMEVWLESLKKRIGGK